jgi:hypothetical protein
MKQHSNGLVRFKASDAVNFVPSLFRHIMQRRLMVLYGRFGTVYRSRDEDGTDWIT